jgi:S1-C subfamily serine protease
MRLGGDVILGVQGIGLGEEGALERIQTLLTRLAPGEKVRPRVLREGKLIDLEAAPGAGS